MQNKNNLQDKFKNFGAQPTDALWDSIASNLDNKKKKRAIWFWWIGSGFAAILALGFGLTHQFNSNSTAQHLTPINSELEKINPIAQIEKSTDYSQQNIETIKTNITNQDILEPNSKQEKQHSNLTASIEKTVVQKNNTNQSNSNSSVGLKTSGGIKKSNSNTSPLDDVNIALNDLFVCVDCNLKQKTIETKLIPQNSSKSAELSPLKLSKKSRQFEYSITALTYIKVIEEPIFTGTLDSQVNSNGIIYSGDNESSLLPSTNSIVYKTTSPLTLRLGISTQLYKRFKIQSGLDFGWIYTRPIDHSIPISSSNFTIGVPLFLDYTILDKMRFDLSTKLGVLNDFSVVDYSKSSQSSTFIFTPDYFGGVETGLSINYKLNEKLKLGIGAGLKWYYYKSHALFEPSQNDLLYNFNLGLTWNY